jgi:predicted solute-binding protein
MNSDGCEQIFRDYIIVPKMDGKYVDGDFIMSTSEYTNTSTLTQKVGDLGDSWGHKHILTIALGGLVMRRIVGALIHYWILRR